MQHELTTLKFIELLKDEELKSLVEESINKAKEKNPDRLSNPAQNLEELYSFLDWSVKCMPWDVITGDIFENLYLDINQSINYFWFLFGQKLDRLKDKGYYLPTLEYHEPIASWIRDYCNAWGDFLSTEESWNDEYYKLHFKEEIFGMNNGWYEESNIWKSYNDFFSRHLKDSSVRPIGNAQVVSPADAAPEGSWHINDEGYLEDVVTVKAHAIYNIKDIFGKDSKYKNSFNGGTFTHTFLNVFDYHRYHFPVDGKILEMGKIKGVNAVGGHTYFDPEKTLYCLDCGDTNWQIIETRDYVIIETEYGLVAVIPIGMSQICSCNFESNIKVGDYVKKGDPMGYFLFGGSDIVMLFEKTIAYEQLFKNKEHMLMGENYAHINKK